MADETAVAAVAAGGGRPAVGVLARRGHFSTTAARLGPPNCGPYGSGIRDSHLNKRARVSLTLRLICGYLF